MQKVIQVNHTAQSQPLKRSLIPETQHMHLLSSHQEAQKWAIQEACLCAKAEKQQDALSTPVASLSNLSAPAFPSVSHPTLPRRHSEADLSFSDSASDDDSNPHPPWPWNGKGIHFCSFSITLKLNKCTFLGKTVVDDNDDKVPNRWLPNKCMSTVYQYDTCLLNNYIGSKCPIITIDDSEGDNDGVYQDISLMSITPAPREWQVGKTHDVDTFFESSVAIQQNNGSVKNIHTCKKCLYIYVDHWINTILEDPQYVSTQI